MSRVEMSLEEYNEMKEKIYIYEEIISAFTTPYISNHELQTYKNNERDEIYISLDIIDNLTRGSKTLLQRKIRDNILNTLKSNNVVGDLKINDISTIYTCLSAGHVTRISKEKSE